MQDKNIYIVETLMSFNEYIEIIGDGFEEAVTIYNSESKKIDFKEYLLIPQLENFSTEIIENLNNQEVIILTYNYELFKMAYEDFMNQIRGRIHSLQFLEKRKLIYL
ncbi:hypothetical protein [Enterococcus alishanensis]